MLTKEIGATGIAVAEIGLGTWDYRGGPDGLRRGLECGALFIDTAESYGTESVVGQSVAGIRDQVFIATKVSAEHFRRDDLKRAADDSLQRLGIDVIDLYQLHAPNPDVPLEETIGAMTELIQDGKIRFIGVSNFSVEQLQRAGKAAGNHPIVSNQVRYNLIDRTIENGLLQYCQASRITVIAYSPLSRDFHRIQDCDPDGVIDKLACDTARTRAQIALNWCVSRDAVVAIPKSNSVQHIVENCAASDWRLSADQLHLLDTKIQYRHRGRFDSLVRRYTPRKLRTIGLRVVSNLPTGLRRRLS